MRWSERSLRLATLALLLLILTLTPGCLFFPRKATPTGGSPGAGTGIGSVKGQVLYMDTRRPALGVAISCFGEKTVVVTDEEGRFSLSSLTSGWQTVYARKEEYVTAAETLNLQPGQSVDVIFLLQPTSGHLHGASSRVPDLCGSCHVLHQQPLLLGGSDNAPCLGCHQSNYPRMSTPGIYAQTLHSTVAADNPSPVSLSLPGKSRGECVNCHEPHGINNSHRHLLTISSPTSSNPLCYTCHTQPGSGHTKDYPGQAACEAADNPHMRPSSTRPDLFSVYPGSEAETGECYNCHNPHGATQDGTQGGPLTTAMTRDEEEKLCVKCHTYLADRLATGTKHKCSMCHNPHQVKKNSVRMIKKPGVATGELVAVTTYYGTHRQVSNQLTNAYCLGCHNSNAGNPYAGKAKLPDLTGTAFKNITTAALPNANYRDLHKVHTVGPIGDDDGLVKVDPDFRSGWTGYYAYQYAYRQCYDAGYHEAKGGVPKTAENKVWCIDCHDVHPHSATAANQRGRLLRTTVIPTATLTSNANGTGYNDKASCGMNPTYACHRGKSRDNLYNGCDWCHTAPGSPGYACDCTDKTCPPYYGSGDGWGEGGGGTNGFRHGLNHYDSPGISGRRPVVL